MHVWSRIFQAVLSYFPSSSRCNINSSFGRTGNTSAENLFSGCAVKPPSKVRVQLFFQTVQNLADGLMR